jgi:hypothetical protein
MILSGGHEMSSDKKRSSARGDRLLERCTVSLEGIAGAFQAASTHETQLVLKRPQDASTTKFSAAAEFFNLAAMLGYLLGG